MASAKRPCHWTPGVEKPWQKCIFGESTCTTPRKHCHQCQTFSENEHFEPAHYAEFLWALFHPEERAVAMRFKEVTIDKAKFVEKFRSKLRGE